MKLNKHYSIDECIDESKLFAKLDELSDENKVTYLKEDKWLLKITNLDLTELEEIELSDLLESLDVFAVLDLEDDEDGGFDDGDYDGYGRGYDDYN